jgi:hypothetical protein
VNGSDEVDALLRGFAPDDVRTTVTWLLDHGYVLADQRPATGLGTFGSSVVYSGQAEVTVTVDRSQWYLDIAQVRGAESYDYDLLVAAHSGRPYWECFPWVGKREWRVPLPRQLPPGVSWLDTLPAVLAWLANEDDIASAVKIARDQRLVASHPESATAKRLRRAWRAAGMPLPS